ncbi:galacturonan 1,4-alpha-galacturonidase [Ranunculus cassubicifolius]
MMCVFLHWASLGWAWTPQVQTRSVNVMDYGAVGDGKTNDDQAFLKAWKVACASATPAMLLIPGKLFLLNPVAFQGPCMSKIHVQISGYISAPKGRYTSEIDHWISFHRVKGLVIQGPGTINGQGHIWWKWKSDGGSNSRAPTVLFLNSCDDVLIHELRIINSPKMHMVVHGCTAVTISKVTVAAPKDSPNTDGIHVEYSNWVEISSSVIGTGDDCISIGTNTSNVNIWQIMCGPGHGISIGSLGQPHMPAAVESVRVSDCTIQDAMYGVRIKTKPGGSGFVRGIIFENIKISSSENPIFIDQYYANGGHNYVRNKPGVSISDVMFRNVWGTLRGTSAITLNCSDTVWCSNIQLQRVYLKSEDFKQSAVSNCYNVHGTFSQVDNPPVCISSH